MELYGFNEQDIIDQVNKEYQYSLATVTQKRQRFRDNDELLNDIRNKDKLDMKTIHSLVETMMALYYSDEINVEWEQRQMSGAKQAKNLNALSSFDYEDGMYDILNYEVQLNRLMRGVGIRLFNNWNEYSKSSNVICCDTRSWIPDPNGWFDPRKFRYHGFEMIKNLTEITEANGYFNCDKITSTISPEQYNTKSREQMSALLSPMAEDSGDNGTTGIYTHMSTFFPEGDESDKGEKKEQRQARKYIATLANNRTTLISFTRIEATSKEEEKNPELIQFPVALNYLSPKEGDPYGTSVPDLSQDKHRYINVMANLMYVKEKNLALGDDYVYNPDIIKNGNDLITPTLGVRYIPGNPVGGSIANAILPIPKNPVSQSTYNFNQYLTSGLEKEFGLSNLAQGLPVDRNITATESVQIQENSNIKIIFRNKINSIGDKFFWNLWYQQYKINFKAGDKKIVKITNSYGTMNVEFTKDMFITDTDPDVVIRVKSDVKAEYQKLLGQFTPLALQIAANPNVSEAIKRNITLELLTLMGMDSDKIEEFVDPIYEEIDALDKLELLNNNILEGAQIDQMDVDHRVYIRIFQRALDTPAKWSAISARKQALLGQLLAKKQQEGMQGQGQGQGQGQMNAMTNMAGSQMMNQNLQQNANPTQSLQSVSNS